MCGHVKTVIKPVECLLFFLALNENWRDEVSMPLELY